MSTWKVIKQGNLGESPREIEFDCPGCKTTAKLPVRGIALAQLGSGIVFDGDGSMPDEIQCRKCGRIFARD